MFGFLGFILIFILFIVLLGIALLGNIIRTLLGFANAHPNIFTATRIHHQPIHKKALLHKALIRLPKRKRFSQRMKENM